MWISAPSPSDLDSAFSQFFLTLLLAALYFWVVGRLVANVRALRILRTTGMIIGAPVLLFLLLQLGAASVDSMSGGAVRNRIVGRNEAVNGLVLPKGTTVIIEGKPFFWNPKHMRSARFDDPYKVDGVSVVGDVEFDYVLEGPDARLKKAKLAGDQVLDGIPCRGGQFAEFDVAGRKLSNCTLSRPLTTGTCNYPAGSDYNVSLTGKCKAQ